MKSEKQESTAHRLSFTGPLLLFVLLFVICCGVLACVFVRADATSREAEIYNASVSLCRSQAERIRSGEMPEDEEMLYFDRQLQSCEKAKGVYCVTFETKMTEEKNGTMCKVTISAGKAGEKSVYQLESTVYRPQED